MFQVIVADSFFQLGHPSAVTGRARTCMATISRAVDASRAQLDAVGPLDDLHAAEAVIREVKW